MRIDEIISIKNSNIAKASIFILSSKIITIPIGMLLLSILGRNLSTTEFGLLSFVLSSAVIISSVLELNINTAITVISSSHFGKKMNKNGFAVLKLGLLAKLAVTMISLPVGVSLSGLLANNVFHNASFELPLVYTMILATAINLNNYLSTIVRTLHKFRSISLIRVTEDIIRILLISLFIIKADLTVSNTIISYIIALLLSGVAYASISPVINILTARISKRITLEVINFNKWLMFGLAISTIGHNIAAPIITYFISVESAGLFYAAFKILSLMFLLSNSLSFILLPTFSRLENEERLKNTLKLLIERMSLIAFPIAFGVIAISKNIILIIFGKNYLAASSVLNLLIPGLIAGLLTTGAGQALLSIKRVREVQIIPLVNLISNTIISIALISLFGLNGAAIALSIGYVLEFLVAWGLVFVYIRPNIDILNISKYFIVSLLMYTFVSKIVISNIVLDMIISILAGIIIYSIGVFVLFNYPSKKNESWPT
ncbi:hypothetical protein COT72_03930 [archaeon CG10_big_fil_rev_8_21_14_0_10_43_11]|nr:MAG: hypothetical protein COT72_03930 [archaeon CG10_big_fil_rev_8_21_14_0_10_43_11]